jgi:5-methylcytosine-specific restriction protein A
MKRYCHRCGAVVEMGHKHRDRDKERARRSDPNQQAYRGKGELGQQWRRVREEFLRAHPICQWPEGCLEQASHVHHRDGEGPTGARGLDPSNLQGLCPSHHGQIEAGRQVRNPDGQWTSRKVVER